jgi:general secretion pathway protein F
VPVFNYKGLQLPGETERTGIIDADSPREARIKLRQQNILVQEMTQRKAAAKAEAGKRPLLEFRRRAKGKSEIPIYTRQLATLLASGIPLAQAMAALIEQSQIPDLEAAFRDIREKITGGLSFAEALAYHPAYFDDLFVNMVKAGEAAGNLDAVLSRLADYLQRQQALRSKISAALAYPLVMIGVGVVIVIVLMTFVVPKIMKVVEQSRQTLPFMTVMLKAGADFLAAWWLAIAGVILGLALLHRWSMRKPDYRYLMDKLKLKIPVLGELFRKSAVSRFAISFSTLLKSGVPVLEALTIVKDIVRNEVIAKVLDTVHARIVEGTDIATPIKKSGVFPPVVGYMIAVGEQSGQLEELLDRIAQAYDQEVEVQTQKVTSLLEPLIIVGMAMVVGFIVISVMLPILKISDISRIRR